MLGCTVGYASYSMQPLVALALRLLIICNGWGYAPMRQQANPVSTAISPALVSLVVAALVTLQALDTGHCATWPLGDYTVRVTASSMTSCRYHSHPWASIALSKRLASVVRGV